MRKRIFDRMGMYSKLEERLQLKFQNQDLYKEALMHKSYASEHNLKYDNQRLELLGDAVVQIILTRYLYDKYPVYQEGDLTKIRSALANQDSLACFARHIDLGEYLTLGKGEIEVDGKDRDSTLSDAFEALTGAIYLDLGLDVTRDFFLQILDQLCEDPSSLLHEINPKGALQEWTQDRGMGVPRYNVLSVTGPDHMPSYEVEVRIQDQVYAVASASSRKLAERNAAQKALHALREASKKS